MGRGVLVRELCLGGTADGLGWSPKARKVCLGKAAVARGVWWREWPCVVCVDVIKFTYSKL